MLSNIFWAIFLNIPGTFVWCACAHSVLDSKTANMMTFLYFVLSISKDFQIENIKDELKQLK